MEDPVHGRPLPRPGLRTVPEHRVESARAAHIVIFGARPGHAPAVTGFRARAWFALAADGDAGLGIEFFRHGLVEQHVRRETGFGRVVGAIRFVRAVHVVVPRPGTKVGVPVLVLRLQLVRCIAERHPACVDMQCAGPVSEQVVGEIPVQGLAGQTDGFVRGFQLAVPAGPLLRLFGGGREHIPFGFRLPAVRRAASPAFHVRIFDACGTMPDYLGPFRSQLPVHEQARIRPVRHAGRVHPVDLVANLEARILDRAGEPMIRAARGERGHVASRFQNAQDAAPQIHVERDAGPVESPVHETDLVRRVGDDGIHAVVR